MKERMYVLFLLLALVYHILLRIYKLDNFLQNLEIPVVAYRKEGQYMEVDLSVQSEATAEYNLNAIKEFSSFNEYFIGEKLGLFGEERTGTQIYIWNFDRWGNDYTLEWNSGKSSENPVHSGRGDILIRSRRVRSRPGQTSNKVCAVTLHQFVFYLFEARDSHTKNDFGEVFSISQCRSQKFVAVF